MCSKLIRRFLRLSQKHKRKDHLPKLCRPRTSLFFFRFWPNVTVFYRTEKKLKIKRSRFQRKIPGTESCHRRELSIKFDPDAPRQVVIESRVPMVYFARRKRVSFNTRALRVSVIFCRLQSNPSATDYLLFGHTKINSTTGHSPWLARILARTNEGRLNRIKKTECLLVWKIYNWKSESRIGIFSSANH